MADFLSTSTLPVDQAACRLSAPRSACRLFYGCPYLLMPSGCANCPFGSHVPTCEALRNLTMFLNDANYPQLYLLQLALPGIKVPSDIDERITNSRRLSLAVYDAVKRVRTKP